MAEFNTCSIAVPAEDSAIGDALDQLEVKLTVWCDAFGDAQRALLDESERVASAAQAAAQATVEPQAPAAELQAVEPQQVPDDEAAWPEPAAQPAEPEAAVPHAEPEPAPETTAEVAEPANEPTEPVEVSAAVEPEPVAQIDADDDDDVPDEQEQARLQAEQEERELLESLDPKVRMEIRIRRRLDNSKSVKELLEEVFATSPQSEDESNDRKWWKRGGKK